MTAVDKLFAEHRLIERVINALEAFISTEGDCDRCELNRLVTFFREYADLNHHEKEEEFLMPALSDVGVRWDEGIMAQIRKDHDFERHLLQTLRHAAMRSDECSPEDRRSIAEVAGRFVQFMRGHIAREDNQLLPLVREKLTGAALADLDAKMTRFDAKRETSGETAMLTQLGEELAARYGR